jgi:serine/threonine-protein kinase
MKEGQKVGPFIIEKKLGSGAMGAVYLALYTKNNGRVALKAIAPGLTDNDSNLRRFGREADILKQLKHPNIVKFYGHGKLPDGSPFYIMEYINGESLDRVMARRGRFTWEEVVALGQQLCSALQHAHEHGIIHRDLKPSNLMMLADGTIKLTDFGIAKDLDRTELTAQNCTVGTASYMSPEQCRGERNLTPHSDLYSLGVLFYELLTGQKPFKAETPMEMFMKHLKDEPERPSRLKDMLDTPVGLDTLIMQLLAKKPEQRARDAAAVGQTLAQVAERVAAQQSAGVAAVSTRAIDRPRGAAPLDEEDKEAARALRQAVTGKKLRKKRKPLYAQVWAQAVVLIVLIAFAGGGLWWSLQPPSADKLYQQAERVMKAKSLDDRGRAVDPDGPITAYFRYYGRRQDAQAAQMRRWADEVHFDESEQKLRKLLRNHKNSGFMKPQEGVETRALNAALAEDAGDLAKAQKTWEDLLRANPEDGPERPWVLLGQIRLKQVAAAEALAGKIEAADKTGQPFRPASAQEQLLQETLKAAHGADAAKARACWEDLRTKYEDDPEQHLLVLVAADQICKLKKGEVVPPDKPAPEKKKDKTEAPAKGSP